MKCLLQNKNKNKIKCKIKTIFQNTDLKARGVPVFSARLSKMGVMKFSATFIPSKFIVVSV